MFFQKQIIYFSNIITGLLALCVCKFLKQQRKQLQAEINKLSLMLSSRFFQYYIVQIKLKKFLQLLYIINLTNSFSLSLLLQQRITISLSKQISTLNTADELKQQQIVKLQITNTFNIAEQEKVTETKMVRNIGYPFKIWPIWYMRLYNLQS
ncbi:unnamed protein product [Paramecium octaurelia]|uniref:Uncharacterized protein n=1 Tax=Paramecium octaurelia TaxID=43137 RepID=A0A8S1XSN7_PAROT|nr:unnamed protein product [Paramecium octaurelia]